jgi:hypothetical protein
VRFHHNRVVAGQKNEYRLHSKIWIPQFVAYNEVLLR